MRRQRYSRSGVVRSIAWLLAASLMFLPRSVTAQIDIPENRPLKAAVAKLIADMGVRPDEPGIAVLAKRPGRILLMEGYGLANLQSKQPITPCTRFELASVSKPFTATAVLILQERGLLSINDDVRKFIPELPQYRGGPLRIRDLLFHISGLTDYLELEDVPKANGRYWVNSDYLPALARAPLDFPIGSKYEYNNTNYMLLGLIIGRAAKQPFGQFLRENIFSPVGMTRTFVYDGPASIPADTPAPCNNAIGYVKEERSWQPLLGFPPNRPQPEHLEVGDGAIWSNLEDMAKWDAAIRTNKLLKPATMKLALTGSRQNSGYGLGWQLYLDGDELYGFGHDGYWEGFQNSYYSYLTGKHTIVLLSNRGRSIDLDKLWKRLSNLLEIHAKE